MQKGLQNQDHVFKRGYKFDYFCHSMLKGLVQMKWRYELPQIIAKVSSIINYNNKVCVMKDISQ